MIKGKLLYTIITLPSMYCYNIINKMQLMNIVLISIILIIFLPMFYLFIIIFI